MKRRNLFLITVTCILLLSHNLFSQIVVQGTVTDNGAEFLGNGAEPIENALVTLTDQANANRTFSDYTDAQGQYDITIWATGVDDDEASNPTAFNLYQNYPNPFNPSTVIAYEMPKVADMSISIYNVLGIKVKTLYDGYQTNLAGHYVWDGTDDAGRGVSAGVYIYALSADGVRINKKMLMLDGHSGSADFFSPQPLASSVGRRTNLQTQVLI